MTEMLNLTLKVWRQAGPESTGEFATYTTKVADDASFLEMLDYVILRAGRCSITLIRIPVPTFVGQLVRNPSRAEYA